MLRFATDSDKGRLLGLGLAEGNLERLEKGDPIVVTLDEQGGMGRLVIASSEDGEGLAAAMELAGDEADTLLLDGAALEALRAGEVLLRSLVSSTGFANAMLFSGPDEASMLLAMRLGGMLPDDAEIAGLDEYAEHEANACPGCPLCDARRAAEAKMPPAARAGLWTRLMARQNLAIAVLLGLFLLVAGGITLLIKAYRASKERDRVAKVTQRRELAFQQAMIDQGRRALLDARDPATLSPKTSHQVCPFTPRKPPLLNKRMVLKSPLLERIDRKEGLSSFESRARWLLVSATLDLMPAQRNGVGPLHRRLHRDDEIDKRRRPLKPALMRSFVITRWRDPRLPKDIDKTVRDAPEGTKARFTAGLVAGRLLLYSYADKRFVCASPEVEALTPALTLVRQDDAIKPGRKLIDDALHKARLETVLAALRTATRNLRKIVSAPR
jgi:hypothetical protein